MTSPLIRLVAAALLGLAGTAIALPSFAAEFRLTVLGVGDIYAFDGGAVRGGFARLNALARAERAANPNTIYVFDGDMISPSLLSGLDHGANTIELTNVVPFDLAVPGNHEFDFGPDVFMERVAESDYPWAAINVAGPDGKPVAGVGFETVMKEYEGVKVALVPIANDETPVLAVTGDWKFKSSVAMALNAAQHAREAGADIVIAVTHTGHAGDYALQGSGMFDVVVSGHDHDLRVGYDGRSVYVETSTEANYVPIVDLDVTVTEAKGDKPRSVSWTPNFRIIDTATITPDPETVAIIERLSTKLSVELDVEIGTTTTELDSTRAVVRGEESSWGDVITDAMKGANGADVAIISGGAIRGDKIYPAGTRLLRKDVFTELPFGNKTVVTELTGADLLAGLENGFSEMDQGTGRFPQVSGLVVEVDANKAPGARVVSVLANGEPLDPARRYKLATNEYMLAGGDGYTALERGQVLIDASAAHLTATDVINYITAAGAVGATVEGRIVIKK